MASKVSLIFRSAVEARDAIMLAQKKEIAKLYEEWADEVAEKARYIREHDAVSATMQALNLANLERQLRATSRQVSKEVYEKTTQSMHLVSEEVLKCNSQFMMAIGFGEAGSSMAFTSVPDRIVRNIVTGQIYEGGWNLSKAIWTDNEKQLRQIHQIIAAGRATNESAYDTAKKLEEYVTLGRRKSWNMRMPDGRYIYKKSVDYSAQRLVRTMAQHAYQQTMKEVVGKNPLVDGFIWHANGSRPCPLCQDRDGQFFTAEELPMDHPMGQCTMEPCVDWTKAEDRLADWFNGEEGDDPELDAFAAEFGFNNY